MSHSLLGNPAAGEVPTITSILTIPGLDTSGQESGLLQVGIVLDDRQVAWSTCGDFQLATLPGYEPPYSVEDSLASIEDRVIPSLVGQKLDFFRRLASVLESLTEKVTIRRPMPQPEDEAQGVSRRAIISGFLASARADESATRFEVMTIERAIHPAIRLGLSQALLLAVSLVQGDTVTEVIAKEFDLPIPATAVELQMPIKRGQRLQLPDQISTLAYSVGGTDFEESLGPNGERIQRFVRQLRQSVDEAGHERQIAIHLDVAGGLGQIFDQDAGKILGALYGLEQAAAPCLIRVQDPLIMDDLNSQVEALGQLCSYMRMRGMSLQLVASAGINTLDDVRTFVQAKAAHMIHLVLPRLGTIQQTIVASQECRARGIGVLLEGSPSVITSQAALAMQPDVLTYPGDQTTNTSIAAIHNEMARTLAWLARNAE